MTHPSIHPALMLALALTGPAAGQVAPLDPGLQALGAEFFAWRAVTQPATGDDIPRVERPPGWTPEVAPGDLEAQRRAYRDFRQRLETLPREGWQRADSVDYLLLRSAIERVNWELNILRQPHRNPDFYVHQTLGALYELLLISSPLTAERAGELVTRLRSVPRTVAVARENLSEPVAPFARIALDNLSGVTGKLERTAAALRKSFPRRLRGDLDEAISHAGAALESYARWLEQRLPEMATETAIGRENYIYFLKYIALIPHAPEELLAQGRQAWNRSLALEATHAARNAGLPEAALFPSSKAQMKQSRRDERAIRAFLEERDIMSVPDWLQHYVNRPTPEHIAPLAHMGVVNDLTSAARLDEDAVSYMREPSPDLPFFRLASAQDPRPIIIHEGVPGHYYQMALAWRHPDPIRRQFFDSGPNEGIGFYVEELLMDLGLFDDRPRTREIITRFMRLRALRVEVDIRLALGSFTIEQAGAYLAETVPLDVPTATWEAGFFAFNPGQAISYQIGKLQIEAFLADTRIAQGEAFSLRAFHDGLMLNGNVPIALQRWEALGKGDEVGRLW
ncbi:MAG: DUF885 family protein [Candidatus Marinimicrobia bacterium]|nr:DUF885 family protein [Candidatus Neomarinimicrobiota bacterium]